ncbi:MAG: DNA repair protein RadC [Alphaproteobacteria bacterium]|nr:DNA repair protein RadC [Alphaproteobacteria bacterium]
MTPDAEKKDKNRALPHHAGHRDRLRERFLKSGLDGLQDYELLELVLFAAIPRRDVKPLAKQLLSEFGGVSGVLNAPVAELQKVKGMSENAAVLFKAVQGLTRKMLLGDIEKKPVLGAWQKLIDYCHVAMAHEKREHFRVLFLNRKNQLIADEVQQVGTVDHTPVYPREIVKRALDLGATALILVHNHPSGDPSPSDSDISMTEEIIRAAAALDILVHDHLIISQNGHVSFKSLGLLAFTA